MDKRVSVEIFAASCELIENKCPGRQCGAGGCCRSPAKIPARSKPAGNCVG